MNTWEKVSFRLLFITDRKLSGRKIISIIKSASDNGLKAVQLREKDLPAVELLNLARKVREVTKKNKTKLIINDRLDIALLAGADGLHVPVNGMKLKFKNKFAWSLITGKSVHSLKEALTAQKEGFDYLLFGPVFRTPAKVKFGSPQGLNKLKQITNKVKIPVFAVGGISPERAKKCLQNGAHGVAVIRSIMKSGNIKITLKEYENSLGAL